MNGEGRDAGEDTAGPAFPPYVLFLLILSVGAVLAFLFSVFSNSAW